jgi:ATP-binding cassette subfamily F protein 3
MVTHNEMLLHGLAQRLIVFQGGGASVFEGSYQRFLEDRGWDDERALDATEADENLCERKEERKELRRLRAEITREKAKALKPLEKRLTELENKIATAEAELGSLYESIESASKNSDGAAIAELSIKIHARKREIDTCFQQLESVSLEYEKRKSAFELRMKELDLRTGAKD